MKSFIAQEDRKKWIPIAECKDGHFYYIHARNSRGGIYNSANQEFIISRSKMSDNFIFEEFHWDALRWDIMVPHHSGKMVPLQGSAKPIREICKAPEFKNDEERLAWLNEETPKLPDPWEDPEES